MQKKLTITIDEEVYDGLRKTIGPRKISRFVQEIVRPHVVRPNLKAAYAEMAKDKHREKEAAVRRLWFSMVKRERPWRINWQPSANHGSFSAPAFFLRRIWGRLWRS